MKASLWIAAVVVLGLVSQTWGADAPKLPPAEPGAKERLEKSPRHGEFVDIPIAGAQSPTGGKPVRAYVVYPEKKEKAGVVIVIHEIFGLSDWIRSVADQLAADGFIAIAPDFLSGKGEGGGGTETFKDRGGLSNAIRGLKSEDVIGILNATAEYARKLPASNGKYGTIGFCWGGGKSFEYATAQPELSAAVLYYGTSPRSGLENIKAPVLGMYGSDDARVNATVGPAQEKMKELNKPFTANTHEGAGHGFLRQQDGRNGANMKATEQAWPATIEFFREKLK